MGRYNEYDDEFARADAREKELQRQMGMDDGPSSPRPMNAPQQNFGSYNNYNSNYNNYNNFNNSYPPNSMQFNGANGFPPPPTQAFSPINRSVYARNVDPRAAKRAFTAITVIFLVVSVILLGIMLIVVLKLNDDYKNCTYDVEAVVVGNRPIMKSTGKKNTVRTSYYTVYKYEYNGKQYQKASKSGHSSPKHSIGEKVTIHIDPNDPTSFYDERDDWVAIAVLAPIGGFFFLLGTIFAVLSAKMKKKIQSSMQ